MAGPGILYKMQHYSDYILFDTSKNDSIQAENLPAGGAPTSEAAQGKMPRPSEGPGLENKKRFFKEFY